MTRTILGVIAAFAAETSLAQSYDAGSPPPPVSAAGAAARDGDVGLPSRYGGIAMLAYADTAPDARTVTAAVSRELRAALFGTSITSWCVAGPGGACRPDASQSCPATPEEVQAKEGPRVVVVCVTERDPPACATPPAGVPSPYPRGCEDSPLITVRVIGFVASLVPPGFGPGAAGFELPTDISATTHTLRFAP